MGTSVNLWMGWGNFPVGLERDRLTTVQRAANNDAAKRPGHILRWVSPGFQWESIERQAIG